MSLVQRLPAELLSHTFSFFALPVDAHTEDVVELWNVRPVLACVCRQWKDIATSLPALWNHIWIHRFMTPAFLDFSVRQAATFPLHVALDLRARQRPDLSRDFAPSPPAPVFFAMLDAVLRPAFTRVVQLRAMASNIDEWSPMSQRLASYGASSLAELWICCIASAHVESAPPAGLPFASELRRLTLSGVWLGPSSFASLTCLDVSCLWFRMSVPWAEFRNCLQSAANLVQLRWYSVECFDADDGLVATLPALETLIVSVDTNFSADTLSLLRAPGLQRFHFSVERVATVSLMIRSALPLMRVAVDVGAAFRLPRGRSFGQLLDSLNNARVVDFRQVGDESDGERHVLPEILRNLRRDTALLGSVQTIRIREDAAVADISAVLAGLHGRGSAVRLCCHGRGRQVTEWSYSADGLRSEILPDTTPFDN